MTELEPTLAEREADLRRLQEQVHSLQRQDPFGFLSLTGHRHAIEAIEREIATLRQRTKP